VAFDKFESTEERFQRELRETSEWFNEDQSWSPLHPGYEPETQEELNERMHAIRKAELATEAKRKEYEEHRDWLDGLLEEDPDVYEAFFNPTTQEGWAVLMKFHGPKYNKYWNEVYQARWEAFIVAQKLLKADLAKQEAINQVAKLNVERVAAGLPEIRPEWKKVTGPTYRAIQNAKTSGLISCTTSNVVLMELLGEKLEGTKLQRLDKLLPGACGVCATCKQNSSLCNLAWKS
jgi:hypothetical protein